MPKNQETPQTLPKPKRVDRFKQAGGEGLDPLATALESVQVRTTTTDTSMLDASLTATVPPPEAEPLPPWLEHFQVIPISQIRPGAYQKRRPEARDPQKDALLETSMRMRHEQGILHLDIQVMPDPDDPRFFNPAFGRHRRIEIAKKIGLTELLCQVIPYDRKALAQGTYWENSEFFRQDLTIIEEGLIFQQALEDDPLLTQEGVAALFQLPTSGGRDHVYHCLRAARAMPDVQALIFEEPERSMRVIGSLSQLDKIEDAVQKRAPIIEGFRAKKLSVDQVALAVKAVLEGNAFSLDDGKSGPRLSTPKTIRRYESSLAAEKGFSKYEALLGKEAPSEEERAGLESLRDRIDSVLIRR